MPRLINVKVVSTTPRRFFVHLPESSNRGWTATTTIITMATRTPAEGPNISGAAV